MARITNYSTLKADVLATLERTEDAEAQSLFDGWVSLCEAMFSPVLKTPWLTRFASFTWGIDPLQRFEYLPPSYNGMINVADLDQRRNLDPINSSQIVDFMHPNYSLVRVHCVIGYTIHVYPDPGPPGIPLFLTYYSRGEPLTEENPINTIILQAPSIYKYGVLMQAYHHYGDETNFQKSDAMFQRDLQSNNELDAGWRRGAGARVRMI